MYAYRVYYTTDKIAIGRLKLLFFLQFFFPNLFVLIIISSLPLHFLNKNLKDKCFSVAEHSRETSLSP